MARTTGEAPSAKESVDGQSRPAATAGREALSPQQLKRANASRRAYFRWLRLSRLSVIALLLMAGVFIFWLVPWMPTGLEADDYTAELEFTIYLFAGVVAAGILSLVFRTLALRDRESLLVWAAVYDEGTGLRNRTYLYDRLSLECERAERTGGVFSVIVLEIRAAGGPDEMQRALPDAVFQKAGQILDRLTRPTDLVALLSGSELAILTVGADATKPDLLKERVCTALAEELSRLPGQASTINVVGGVATYGSDGEDPGALVQAAHSTAIHAIRSLARAS